MHSQFMNISLGIYEFRKLSARVNSICLVVLIILFVFAVKRDTLFELAVLGGILLASLVVNSIVAFVWFSKAELALLEGDVKLWTAKRMAPLLFMSIACALVGVFTIVVYPKSDIAMVMIVILTTSLGYDLGDLVKIVVRYKRKAKA